jgi:hypothetical protein
MKLNMDDWKRLRSPSLLLGLALLIAVSLVIYSRQQALKAEDMLKAQQSQLAQARSRYQSSGLEKQNIMKYLPVYQRLIKQGIVGEEKREDWIEALRVIHARHKLFGINYNISKQENYTPNFAVNLGQFVLHRSVMKIQLPLLHEGDLFTLLQALKNEQPSMFLVRECAITRLNTAPQAKIIPNSQAECELDWLTISETQGGAP